MATKRTQVKLTQKQREAQQAEMRRVLDETFGIAPDFEVPPRSEWNRFDRDWNRIERDEPRGPSQD
jgi:hypothetical protein